MPRYARRHGSVCSGGRAALSSGSWRGRCGRWVRRSGVLRPAAAAAATTTGRPGAPSRGVAAPAPSPASAAPGRGFLLSYPASRGPSGRGGEKHRGAPRGSGRPPRSTRPARAPCEGRTGLVPRPAPDSSCAPPAPGGPQPPPTGGRGDRPRGGGGVGLRLPMSRRSGRYVCSGARMCVGVGWGRGRGCGPDVGRGPPPA